MAVSPLEGPIERILEDKDRSESRQGSPRQQSTSKARLDSRSLLGTSVEEKSQKLLGQIENQTLLVFSACIGLRGLTAIKIDGANRRATSAVRISPEE